MSDDGMEMLREMDAALAPVRAANRRTRCEAEGHMWNLRPAGLVCSCCGAKHVPPWLAAINSRREEAGP